MGCFLPTARRTLDSGALSQRKFLELSMMTDYSKEVVWLSCMSLVVGINSIHSGRLGDSLVLSISPYSTPSCPSDPFYFPESEQLQCFPGNSSSSLFIYSINPLLTNKHFFFPLRLCLLIHKTKTITKQKHKKIIMKFLLSSLGFHNFSL